ncbi:MAG: HAMP domain-containing protein, partial [Deltaproteobacteria bacterium]|nr:HAMP domain-containing protein [Deltaproteobacteria bacterium]
KTYLVASQLLPRPLLNEITELARQAREVRQSQLLIHPVRVSHYLTLVVVTLLTLMAAIWLAFYLAREITTPIRQLAEGTVKVAGGDYDIHIQQEGRDEIAFLVQSFNKMTQDLQLSRAQLAATYERLRQSHADLQASQRHLEILLRNVAAGVVAVDAAGRITNVNDSAARMLGVALEEVVGREVQSLLPAGEHARLMEAMAEARRVRKTVETPIHLILPHRVCYLLLKTTMLKDDAGEDHGLVMVMEDLTELERAQRLEAWREVARRIAHEVKNPLTPIKLAAQRLQRRYAGRIPDDGQVFEECTRIISDQVDEIKNLVNQFSHFARLPHLSLAPLDLNALIRETLHLYAEVQPRVSLTFTPDPTLGSVLLDQEQCKRLLLNLMDNALAAIEGGGAISVTVQAVDGGEAVRLVVADTGRGVSDRDKARIFEPYFSTKRGGTGLGLAIVHSIVADHQGQIRVEDNEPTGARFIIELPTHRGHHAGNHSRRG